MSNKSRHVDSDGLRSRKHDNTLVKTVRKDYGEEFAPGTRSDAKLSTVKRNEGLPSDASLNDLLRHFGMKK
jgi:hypothetical protein